VSEKPGLRPVAAAWTLFLLAPYVGECLLGNLPVTAAYGLLFLAPLYGCGALLIRELTRRVGGGWPTIILLGAAYALVEEALVDQMVFTPRYLDLHSFAGYAPLPWLGGASGTLIVASLTMHTIWSICVPIALAEALSSEPRQPWLRRRGLTLTVVVFGLACLFLGDDQAQKLHFHASTRQYAVAVTAVLLLIVAALAASRRRRRGDTSRAAPSPRTVGITAFSVTSAYWILWMSVPGTDSWAAQWLPILAWCAAVPLAAARLLTWSYRAGWSDRHRLSAACGALLTYVWVCPIQSVSAGVPVLIALAGWFVYGGVALWLAQTTLRPHKNAPSAP